MFLYGRSQHTGAVQDETEHIQVAYHDNLPQLTQLPETLKINRSGAAQQALAAGEQTLLLGRAAPVSRSSAWLTGLHARRWLDNKLCSTHNMGR